MLGAAVSPGVEMKALFGPLKAAKDEEHHGGGEEPCLWKTPPEGLKTLKPPQNGHISTFRNPGKAPVKHQAVYPAASQGASPAGTGGEVSAVLAWPPTPGEFPGPRGSLC